MILSYVQHAKGVGTESLYAFKLQCGHFRYYDVPIFYLHCPLGYRYANIAQHERALARGFEKLACQCSGGGLAVGAAYAYELCAPVAIAVSQLYFAYHFYAHILCFPGKRLEYRYNRAEHQQIHAVQQCLRLLSHCVHILDILERFLESGYLALHVVNYYLVAVFIEQYCAGDAAFGHSADKSGLLSVLHNPDSFRNTYSAYIYFINYSTRGVLAPTSCAILLKKAPRRCQGA